MTWLSFLAGLAPGALMGIFGKAGTDLLTDRRRQDHDRRMRRMNVALEAAADLLAAAERIERASRSLDAANLSRDGSKSSGDQKDNQHYRDIVTDARREFFEASAEAENACARFNLLFPDIAELTRRYLDLCRQAAMPEKEEAKELRKQTAREVADAVRKDLGI